MLTTLTNAPRDYAWGSRTLIAELEGRPATAGPEAEVWFGDHPSDPAELDDGTPLDAWTAQQGEEHGLDGRLPYLLKILAAASPLSIQVHPSKTQAEEGYAREAALIPGAVRNYSDDNHKPEMIVALSDRFEALSGLRYAEGSRRLLASLGGSADELIARIPDDASLKPAVGWLLSGDAQETVERIIRALADARSTEFASTLANARRIAQAYPSDPGVVVALLMNHVILRRGEGMFLRAGLLHAYVSGLGIEIMAASDNVLRGGLTPKHIDVDELMSIIDATPGPVPVVLPTSANGSSRGVELFPAPVSDFSLMRARVSDGADARIALAGVGIVLATEGEVTVSQGDASVVLSPGRAALATPDDLLDLSGSGTVFVAQPGV
ncbi:mannose-6-phosphate isomerase, class I [Microbacterium halotolerans]|uniref:mannose-6-phosphate isomerase, class I n=1 Tax=Microbacterium halotolerans TaxID=246613 RepID=UPI000E6ACBBE|nr:mannose-6-phosphate isomerase, class I [Microbacterium halotolerans]